MNEEIKRNLGEQPLTTVMDAEGLSVGAVAEASPLQMTRKMVTRAMKGRRLTRKAQLKVLAAVNAASGKAYEVKELFTY